MAKRKVKEEEVVAAPEPRKRSTRTAAVAPAEAKPAKPAPANNGKAAAPAKNGKAAAPAKGQKPAPKRGSRAKVEVDPNVFAVKLLDAVKTLVTVCDSVTVEDPDELSVTTTDSFKTHGEALLSLLPEEARMPLVEAALRYQEEIESDPQFDLFEDDEAETNDDEGEGEDEGQNDEEDAEEDELMIRMLGLFQFKQFFTQAEAATFVEKADEAIEASLESMIGAIDEEDEEDDGDEDDDEEGEEGEDEDDDDLYGDAEDDEKTPWKDE